MASTKYIQATVIRKNGTFFYQTPVNQQIDCEQSVIRTVEWLVPNIVNGILEGYINRIIQDPVADVPPPGSIKTIRIHNTFTDDTFWVAAGDSDTAQTLVTMCNECCEGDTDFTKAFNTIAKPVLEDVQCNVPGGTNNFVANTPANPFAANYTLDNLTHDGGQALTGLALAGAGYASTAALATALNTQVGAYGTWSAPTTTSLKLASTTVHSLNLVVVRVPKTYCLALPASGFTGVTLVVNNDSNNPINVPITATVISRANIAGVIAELKKYDPTGVYTDVDNAGVHSMQYVGNQKMIKIMDLAGTTHADFSAGAC